MSEETKCKICGKSFSRFTVHLRSKHKMSKADYDKKFGEEELPMSAIVADDEKEIELLPGTKKTLDDILDEYQISQKQLERILGRRMRPSESKDNIRIAGEMAKRREDASERASRLAKEKDEIKTPELEVAEILITEYGYKCIDVVGLKDPKHKYWHLKR